MKKLCVLFFLSLQFLATRSNAQDDESSAVKEGDNTVNLYYGTSIIGSIYKNLAPADAFDFSTKVTGPFGLMFEHMVTDGIGLGFEVGYGSTKINYHDELTYYGTNGQTTDTYDYTMTFTTFRAMFRANFHFAHAEKFDAYALVNAGYRKTSFDFTSNDPTGTSSVSFNSPIPFGIKAGVGLRYFFVPAVGINLEIAAGTPLISGGLSFKF